MVGPDVPLNEPGVTSPFGMLRFAEEYRKAAKLVGDANPERRPAPAYMLVGQSIELSLKSYLLARGITLEALKYRPYGHDLSQLLAKARQLKIERLVELHQWDVDAIEIIAPLYGSHEFRYIVNGSRILPNWEFLMHTTQGLTRGLHHFLLRRRVGKEQALQRIALRGFF